MNSTPIQLICDPHDCGLREGRQLWNHPPTALRSNPESFPRVSRAREAELVAMFGDMVPQHPGEWSLCAR